MSMATPLRWLIFSLVSCCPILKNLKPCKVVILSKMKKALEGTEGIKFEIKETVEVELK